jgi:carboxylesterase type B
MSASQKYSFILFIIFVQEISTKEIGLVEIENGLIRGELRDYYYAFEGIPYAKAPVGVNRFQSPKPLDERWNEIKEYKKYGSNCIQWNLHGGKGLVVGNEDCLFLNVYVPKTVMESEDAKVQVFFYIHGGAFMFGGADFYSPREFMKKKLILVTINYRLGPMGFLSTEDEILPGNLGLKDQVMALKWVNKNIGNFNGDKKEVTIIGFSAGGASVHLHYMSPLSTGLFKNGISMSGCALNPWVITENAKEKAHKLAESLNCDYKDHKKLLNCLLKKPAEDIVGSVELFQPFLYNPFTPFGVVVEKAHKEAFLTENPSEILKKQKIQKVPWLATASKDEGLYPGAEFYRKDLLEKIDENWEDIIPHILHYNDTFTDSFKRNKVSRKIRKQYLQNDNKCLKICEEHFSKFRDVRFF